MHRDRRGPARAGAWTARCEAEQATFADALDRMRVPMSRTDPLLLDAARKLLRAVADPQGRRGEGRDRRAVWQALEDHGLTRAWLPEAAGGAGASLADGFAILTLAGEVALDVALAETLLAGWLAAAAGLSVPDGAIAPAEECEQDQ